MIDVRFSNTTPYNRRRWDFVRRASYPTICYIIYGCGLHLERSRNFSNRAQLYDTMLTLISGGHGYYRFFGRDNSKATQHNWGTCLAWICFRHVAQKFLDLRQQAYKIFVQPDKKSCCAIRTPQLCGAALKYITSLCSKKSIFHFNNYVCFSHSKFYIPFPFKIHLDNFLSIISKVTQHNWGTCLVWSCFRYAAQLGACELCGVVLKNQ